MRTSSLRARGPATSVTGERPESRPPTRPGRRAPRVTGPRRRPVRRRRRANSAWVSAGSGRSPVDQRTAVTASCQAARTPAATAPVPRRRPAAAARSPQSATPGRTAAQDDERTVGPPGDAVAAGRRPSVGARRPDGRGRRGRGRRRRGGRRGGGTVAAWSSWWSRASAPTGRSSCCGSDARCRTRRRGCCDPGSAQGDPPVPGQEDLGPGVGAGSGTMYSAVIGSSSPAVNPTATRAGMPSDRAIAANVPANCSQ